MRSVCKAVLVVLVGVFFWAEVTVVSAAEAEKFGVILPLSGARKNFGDLIMGGALIAQDQINAAGGFTQGPLAGKKLELVFVDNESATGKSGEIAEQFIVQDNYPIVLGGYASSEAMEIAPVAEKHGIPYLCQTGSVDALTQQGFRTVFRLNPPASQYIVGLQDFLVNVVKPQNVAILYEETDFGKSTAAAMRAFCQANGIAVVFDEPYAAKSSDYNVMLLKMKITNPDVVFMVSYLMDAILLTKQSAELGVKPKLFSGAAAGFALPEYAQEAGAAAENVMTADLWAQDLTYPGLQEFAAEFKRRFDREPTYHAAQGHALITVFVDALERAESLRPDDIIAALKETDMQTVFAPVRFEDYELYTNQNRVITLLRQVQKGTLVTVWPQIAARGQYIYPLPE